MELGGDNFLDSTLAVATRYRNLEIKILFDMGKGLNAIRTICPLSRPCIQTARDPPECSRICRI